MYRVIGWLWAASALLFIPAVFSIYGQLWGAFALFCFLALGELYFAVRFGIKTGEYRAAIILALTLDQTIGGVRGLDLRRMAAVPRWRFYLIMADLEAAGIVTHTVGVPESRRGGLPAYFYRLVPPKEEMQ